MDRSLGQPAGDGFTPGYRIQVYHPDTRAVLSVPLHMLTERIERALKVPVERTWLPTLVAIADGLFMQPDAVSRAVARVAALLLPDSGRAARQAPAVLDELTEIRVCEKLSVEELYHTGRIDELSHPRVWELNGWWDRLYGVIPCKSEHEDEEELDIWEDGPPLVRVGRLSLPVTVSPERDEVRVLLERRLLSQYEPLYRLRLSWHR